MKNKIIILFSLYLYIYSYNLQCNKIYSESPFSPHHCSGLNISVEGDTHCCLWKFYDNDSKENVTRCSSIDSEQFQNLTKYIQKKITRDNYTNLDIQCADQETLFCSNVLLIWSLCFILLVLLIAAAKYITNKKAANANL